MIVRESCEVRRIRVGSAFERALVIAILHRVDDFTEFVPTSVIVRHFAEVETVLFFEFGSL